MRPPTTAKTYSMLDIAQPESVEVLIRLDGKVLWVNVDGVCRLRVSNPNTRISLEAPSDNKAIDIR